MGGGGGQVKFRAVTEPEIEDYRRAVDFRFALRRFLAKSDAAIRAAGLTSQRYLLLLAVKAHPHGSPATISVIAEQLQLAQSTATELVDRGGGCECPKGCGRVGGEDKRLD